jgi:hypothetical protein
MIAPHYIYTENSFPFSSALQDVKVATEFELVEGKFSA